MSQATAAPARRQEPRRPIHVDVCLHKRLKQEAAARGLKLGQYLDWIIAQHISADSAGAAAAEPDRS